MATVASVIGYTQQLAQTDTGGIGSVLGIAFYNDALQDMTRDLINKGIDASQTQESYATIAASDSQPGRFVWPPDMFALKTIEADYTATGGQNYLQANKIDISNIQGVTSWDYLRINQPNNEPLFTNHGDTGEIFPTPSSSALLKIVYYLTPTEATAVTDTVAYPQTLDFRMLSCKMASLYYYSQQNKDMGDAWNMEYTNRLNKIGKVLAPQSKQPIKAQGIQDTGWSY